MKKIVATLSLVLVLGIPLAISNIQTLYAWFPSLKPAIAHAIDVVTGYVPPTGPKLRVSHECALLDATATQCWSHLKIASLDQQPVTIERVVVNGRPECASDKSFFGLVTLLAAQHINVSNKTIRMGDAYGVGISCDPVSVKITTDHGEWSGG